MNLEEFFDKISSRCAAPNSPNSAYSSTLAEEVRQAANRGFQIFPEPEVARLTGQPNPLIGEATSDLSRLEELAGMYPFCNWRVAIGPSGLCVVRRDGPEGRASVARMSEDHEDCSTLVAERGDTAWVFFRRPTGRLQASAKRLAPGVTVIADGGSCPVPPSHGCAWANASAEIEAVPSWLRELVFEGPDTPPGNALHVPTLFPRPVPCRARLQFEGPSPATRKGHLVCNQAGFRGGYRVSRRR